VLCKTDAIGDMMTAANGHAPTGQRLLTVQRLSMNQQAVLT